jgi:23S rRNA pseudouridine1911/1915/1917 synthase
VTERVRVIVSDDMAGARLDVFLAGQACISRSSAASLIRSGHVRVNGSPAKPSLRLASRDRVEGEVVREDALSAEPEAFPLNIVYQDADLAVIDKPAGLVVHPAKGHRSGTLANALMARFPAAASVGPADRPGIVHRLDKDTSGLMVVALNDDARTHLQRQIALREAGRHYLALPTGSVRPSHGQIEAPIGRDPENRKRMWVYGIGQRPARTHYTVIEDLPGFTYIEARLDTGRTHQIRVHFAATGHPLAGDKLYHGGHIAGLNRQFLHATELRLRSPSTDAQLTFHSPLPTDLQAILTFLRATSA